MLPVAAQQFVAGPRVTTEQNSSHTETKMTEYLGERKLKEGFCSLAFGDPQLVEVIIREML